MLKQLMVGISFAAMLVFQYVSDLTAAEMTGTVARTSNERGVKVMVIKTITPQPHSVELQIHLGGETAPRSFKWLMK